MEDGGGGEMRGAIRTTYLALAIVPPLPLVTQTNKTARTYHRGAMSNLGLDAAIALKLDQVVEWIPRPCAEEREKEQRTRKYFPLLLPSLMVTFSTILLQSLSN